MIKSPKTSTPSLQTAWTRFDPHLYSRLCSGGKWQLHGQLYPTELCSARSVSCERAYRIRRNTSALVCHPGTSTATGSVTDHRESGALNWTFWRWFDDSVESCKILLASYQSVWPFRWYRS